MQATLTQPRAGGHAAPRGVFTQTIEGRYRPLSVHQIAMAWWLYRAKHITARQFRIYFAACEMAEKRRYTKPSDDGRPRKPSYGLAEIKALTGSRATDTDLTADVKALGRLGLVKIAHRSIHFAISIDQIALPPEQDDVTGFWSFFNQLPNRARRVPVPRRTLRALAKGFNRGVAGMMLALMVRSLYWHRPGGAAGEEGGYRIDGRTKCSWIAEVFGLDRKTVSTARGDLIDLDWLRPIDTPQWQLNKWGQRYTIHVEAFAPPAPKSKDRAVAGDDSVGNSGGGFPSPGGQLSDGSPSPCLNNSTSSTKRDLKTKKPDHARSGPSSVDSRKKGGKAEAVGAPRLTNIRGEDFGDTRRMMELHQQAIEAGHPVKGEKGRLEFFALAERAQRHGHDAPRLFAWLLREKRFDYITLAEEDAAIDRLRRLRQPERPRRTEPHTFTRLKLRHHRAFRDSLGPDERFVEACLVTGRKAKLDPFRIAQARGWTRGRWNEAERAYRLAKQKRWHTAEAENTGFLHLEEDEPRSG